MLEFVRVNTKHPEFKNLIGLLDRELWELYPGTQAQYDVHNGVADIDTALLSYFNGIAVSCGCFKKYDRETAELKRMFVMKEYRGKGIAEKLVLELCSWAAEAGFIKMILETGVRQPEAIRLYEKTRFTRIENFAPYIGMPESICMMKLIK